MVSLDPPSLGYPFRNVWLLITFLISFKFSFNQSFLTSDGNTVTSAEFLGSGMKCDTSEPDYPNVGNALFNSFTTALKYFCKPLSILFSEISYLFHSLCVCLIRSHLFVDVWMYLDSIPNVLKSVCAYIYVIRVIGCTWIIINLLLYYVLFIINTLLQTVQKL